MYVYMATLEAAALIHCDHVLGTGLVEHLPDITIAVLLTTKFI
jgi:hypothetical protein